MSDIELFHFLRPLWLLALPMVAGVWWWSRSKAAQSGSGGDRIAPHLRKALTLKQGSQSAFGPAELAALFAVCVVLAAAGPTWSKQPSPWFAETAPLVVAFEMTDSMRANDVQPTRLERSRFKVLDLLAERTGSRTAVIAYAGSAHIVVPPSTDADVIKPLLESLDPGVMPVEGAGAAAVLPLAESLLGEQAAVGTVLFVTDGFERGELSAFEAFAQASGKPGLVSLVVGTAAGGVALYPDGSPVTGESGARLDTTVDEATLGAFEQQAGVEMVRLTADGSDIRSLVGAINSNLRQADDPDAQWRDEGWWLLWPAALLCLLWFRRGWTLQW